MAVLLAGLLAGLAGCALMASLPPNTPTVATPTSTPASTVQAFLEAIAAADATTALTFIDTPTSDTSMMTDAALGVSRQLAPISNISTTANDSARTIVSADYQMGDKPVTATFHLRAVDQGYLIADGVQKLDVTGACQPCTGVTINGVPITQPSVNLLPGTYQFGESSPLLAVTGDAFSFTGAPTDAWPMVSIKLAPDADATLGAAAQATFDACLQQKTTPTSCGFGIPASDGVAAPGSVTYTPDYSDYKPLSDAGCILHDPSTAEAVCSAPIIINYTAKDASGKSLSGEIDVIMEATIDISDPTHLVVNLSS